MTENEAITEVRFNMSTKGLNENATKRVIEARNMAIQALEKVQAFEAIGTVEECREAVERMKPKKVKDKICDCGDYFGICPVCDIGVANQFGTPYKYCPKCGTKIDWQ